MPHASTTPRTLRQARATFFRAFGFPADGGYDEAWSEAEFGWLTYRVPNFELRREALRRHDLHHALTGYPADWRGESLISAWELASGAGRQPYAWVIALWGLFVGLALFPVDTLRAFLRGRGSRNLYSTELTDELLDAELDRVKADMAVRPADAPGRRGLVLLDDLALFGAWSVAAVAFGVLSLLPTLVWVAMGTRVRCPCAGRRAPAMS